MKPTNTRRGLALVCVLLAELTTARADTAIIFGGDGTEEPSAYNQTAGWQFTVRSNIAVTKLGFYDTRADGLVNPHPVGIWTVAGNLMVQATVPAGTSARREGKFRYVTVPYTTLLAGQTYVIGSLFYAQDGDFYDGADSAGSLSINSKISSVRIRNGYISTTLGFPPNSPGGGTIAYFGPNFQFTTTDLSVSGRVLISTNRAPLDGATVTLAGQNTDSFTSGEFSFLSVSLNSGNTLTVGKSGFATYTGTVVPPAGASLVTLPDILLQPAGTNPIVTGIQAKYDGIFLSGATFLNEYTASVNWNGDMPGSVEFYVNGTLSRSVPTVSVEATAPIDMGQGFHGSLMLGANKLRAVAVNNLGVRSEPYEQNVTIIPFPALLASQGLLLPFELLPGDGPALKWEFNFPRSFASVHDVRQIPFIGDIGADFNFDCRVDYSIRSGKWGVFAGKEWPKKALLSLPSRRPNLPKFKLGNVDFQARGGLKAEGVASQTRGFDVDRAGIEAEFGVKAEIGNYYITDWVPGGQLVRLLDVLKLTGIDPNSIQKITLYGKLGAQVNLMAEFKPDIHFGYLSVTLKPGVEAVYQPDMWVARGDITVGGGLGIEGELAPSLAWKKITGEIFLSIRFEAFGRERYNEKFVILHGTIWKSAAARTSLAGGGPVAQIKIDGEDWLVFRVQPEPFVATPRAYLVAGPERFVANETGAKSSEASVPQASSLGAFRLIGRTPDSGSPGDPGIDPDPPVQASGEAQADLAIMENVFPGSQPAMASRVQELMLLYVSDNGASNDLQFTDIKWTRFDGTNWSVPATIQTNTQAEFAPQVAYDGNGDAIAVWERVADPNFNQTNFTAMAAQMEIVWAKWNHASGAWSTPVPLTSNGYLDHAPLLCGPMADGSVLVTWTANTSNLLMGTNGAGSHVLWAQSNPGSQSWSAPQTLLADLPNRLSQSLSGVSNLAVYAWTRDLDGMLTNANDQQLFYCAWSNGVWGAAAQFTADNAGNRNARVSVSGSGSGNTQEGFESGGFSQLPWTFTGNAPWLVQNGIVGNGSFAAASGTITHSQTSGMSVAVNCSSGVMSFAYRVSSESSYDFLRFYIDGQQKAAWSGSVGWAATSFPVTSGLHTFEWRYTKDGSVSSGSDKAWVDNVTFPASSGPSVYLVWQQGTNLVLSANFSSSPSLVRADSQTAGFADYAMTIGPAGNLALLWQEVSQAGSDAHYRVLDPVSATWSKDAQLFDDPPLERSFAPVWDDVGNLTVAFNKVDMIYTNKTVTLEGGGTVTITNVPQPGRVDLWVTKRQLIKDMALGAGDFTVSAENYLPGAAVTLSATLRNAGDVGVGNAVVAFYDGNPTNGGVLITNVAISGWLEGAATNTVSVLWVVPEPATNYILFAVADPGGAITEFDETNNKLSLSIGGTDLSVSLVSQTAETNGAVRVIAQVQNLGAPSATNSVLAIRRYGKTNAPLVTVAVPLLEPGRLAQVALDLPAGTQPEGEQLYTLRADETLVTHDVDTNNNTTSFAVNLWIDSDGDRMPDSWELANGLNPNDPSDALLDKDADGISNLAEYRAGTTPTDPLSYLRIQSLAVGGTNGVQVVWGSTTNRLYTVQRTSALGLGFGNVAEHILSTPPQNVYFDTTATNANSLFYRIKVE